MVGKQEYEIAIVSKYKEAKKALEILNDSELKLDVFSKCSTVIQLILLKAVDDDLVLPSDFNYLVLKANALLDKLLEYFKEDMEENGVLCNSYIITLDDFKELSTYADKLTRYLRECLE